MSAPPPVTHPVLILFNIIDFGSSSFANLILFNLFSCKDGIEFHRKIANERNCLKYSR